MFGIGSASSRYQRQLVEAHDRKWLVCLVLDEEDHDDERFRLALAVPCDDQGSVAVPAQASLIRFTPADVQEKLDRRARCAEAGHPLGAEKWRNLGIFEQVCDCCEKLVTRVATAEEVEARKMELCGRKGFF